MDISIFTDKERTPGEKDLIKALGPTFPLWNSIRAYVHGKFPSVKDEWAYPGAKYGWSFRMKDSRRVIIYLLPREGYFMAAFNFGMKAYEAVMVSSVAQPIKDELAAARVYAEGRGIRIEIRDEVILPDIKALTEIKLEH